MTHLSMTICLLSALVIPCAYGQGTRWSSLSGSTSGPSNPQSEETKQEQNIAGNWQLSAESTDPPGTPSWTIAGSITKSDTSLKAVFHVGGSNCFEQLTPIRFTGSITHGIISLTSHIVDGQVIAVSGRVEKAFGLYRLTGTYAVNGGCANGGQGNLAGYAVYSLTGHWAGGLTDTAGRTIDWNAQLTQGKASPHEGSFGLRGTATLDDKCLKSGTIRSGAFPAASFILGTTVALDIETDQGAISFLGALDPDGLIKGSYTVTGGSCESTGTGYLSPWEY